MHIFCICLHEYKLGLCKYKGILDFPEVICETLSFCIMTHDAKTSLFVFLALQQPKLNVTSLCELISLESHTCMHVLLVSHLSLPVAFL